MSEVKDQAIKLFGMRIPLPFNEEAPAATSAYIAAHEHQKHCSDHNLQSSISSSNSQQDMSFNRVREGQRDHKLSSETEHIGSKQENYPALPTAEELIDPATTCENPQTPSVEKETSSPKASNNEDQSETSDNSQEKTLKKPDKIIPCPRCNSMDTKFCYYNNYNVNQPRHFCKNCQRYWTAGGTMRNVPVGSGRRKNKSPSSASHYNPIMVSNNVLAFASDSPLCDSMASTLQLAEKSRNCGVREIGEEQSCGSSITASTSSDKGANGSFQESVMNHFRGFPPQVPCFPSPPWPCHFGPPGFPVSFYQTPPYWGCAMPVPWNMPHSAMSPSPNSPNLGKHSRDGHILKQSNSEKDESSRDTNSERCVLIPKTLRIDDPSESAKSSIWSTLGIKNEKTDSSNGGGLFKAFKLKGDEKNHIDQTSLMLQANPAALSRSLNFQESS